MKTVFTRFSKSMSEAGGLVNFVRTPLLTKLAEGVDELRLLCIGKASYCSKCKADSTQIHSHIQ